MLTVEKIKKAVLKEIRNYGEGVDVEYYEVDGESIDIEELRDTLLSHIEQVELEARKFYNADGSFILFDTVEECLEARKDAARKIEQVEKERDDLLRCLRLRETENKKLIEIMAAPEAYKTETKWQGTLPEGTTVAIIEQQTAQKCAEIVKQQFENHRGFGVIGLAVAAVIKKEFNL